MGRSFVSRHKLKVLNLSVLSKEEGTDNLVLWREELVFAGIRISLKGLNIIRRLHSGGSMQLLSNLEYVRS